MNIVYLHSHDTGRIIQPYGHPVPTPNLMKLGAQSQFFGSMFCTNPTCSPSRAALLTGQYPHSCGQLGLAHRGFEMPSFTHHLARYLAGQGYRTALSGIQHVANATQSSEAEAAARIGYLEYLGPAGDADRQAAEWLESRPTEPFFLSCGFWETHREFPELSAEERDREVNGPEAASAPGHPDRERLREDFARYRRSAAVLDRRIGVVLDALERSGMADETIVLCTTDHGIAFPLAKCTLTDAGIGVMAMLRVPGMPARRIDALASHVDLFPTLCDLAGVSRPSWLEGRSLLPVLDGSRDEVREEIFAEVNFHAAPEPKRAVRTSRYKLIRRYDNRDRPVLPNVDDGLSKDAFLEAGWAERAPEPEQLYDLFLDPGERSNRIHDPVYHEIRDTLRGRLDHWMKETDDPLLSGPLTPPVGAQLNSSDGHSPRETLTTVE